MSYIVSEMREFLQTATGETSEQNIMRLWEMLFDQAGIPDGMFTTRWRAYLEDLDNTTYRSITEALREHYGQYSSNKAISTILRDAFSEGGEPIYYDLAGAEDHYLLAGGDKYNIARGAE